MPAILAGIHRPIPDLVASDAAARTHIRFSPPDMKQRSRDKQKHPQKQIHDPPPAADQQPPEAAVAFFTIL